MKRKLMVISPKDCIKKEVEVELESQHLGKIEIPSWLSLLRVVRDFHFLPDKVFPLPGAQPFDSVEHQFPWDWSVKRGHMELKKKMEKMAGDRGPLSHSI